jgi:hypothetical protein
MQPKETSYARTLGTSRPTLQHPRRPLNLIIKLLPLQKHVHKPVVKKQ